MKTLLKLVGLVYLSCSALHAGMYLTALQAYDGKYLCAEEGGGYGVNANRNSIGAWETFIVEDLWAGTQNIVFNDPVGIRAESTNLYWCAPDGGQYIWVNRVNRGAWETFRQTGTFNHGTKARFRSWWQFEPYVAVDEDQGHRPVYFGNTFSLGKDQFTVTILAYMPEPAP
jgi:hypothetical protein